MLGRQASCMCASVDSSHGTVHIMSTSLPVHLIGYTDLFYLHELLGGIWGSAYIWSRLIFGKMQDIYIYIYIYIFINIYDNELSRQKYILHQKKSMICP